MSPIPTGSPQPIPTGSAPLIPQGVPGTPEPMLMDPQGEEPTIVDDMLGAMLSAEGFLPEIQEKLHTLAAIKVDAAIVAEQSRIKKILIEDEVLMAEVQQVLGQQEMAEQQQPAPQPQSMEQVPHGAPQRQVPANTNPNVTDMLG